LSKGRHFAPQALKVNTDAALLPAASSTKFGPESCSQESSMGIATTRTVAPQREDASAASGGSASMVTGSKRAMARATVA
jgi:hypothetical protein